MAKKLRMSAEQYVRITDWLRQIKHIIEENKHTQPEVLALAEKELGFKMALTSIQCCAKIAKIKWANSPPPAPPVPLEREAIIILIGAIAGLYVETGRTIPQGLANLQTTYVQAPIPEPPPPPSNVLIREGSSEEIPVESSREPKPSVESITGLGGVIK